MAAVRAPDRRPPQHAVGEQSRARYPHEVGVAERDGGKVAYEIYGAGEPPMVFVPPWQIVHSRVWKTQIPDFARRHRVIAWDARGNGRSDRPREPRVHTPHARAADLEAVMDAAGVAAGILVGLSSSVNPMVIFAAKHPERVRGLVFVCPAAPLGEPSLSGGADFEARLPDHEGWDRENIHYWRRDFRDYLEYFFSEAFPEPHSTKEREDGVGYGLDTDAESLAATVRAPVSLDVNSYLDMCASITAPALVIQGTDERISHPSKGAALAQAIRGARLVVLEGAGHIPNARHPVVVNLLIRDFVRSLGGGGGHARP
jgi:pimeloyl-ACP methyl ester carboxylesterase